MGAVIVEVADAVVAAINANRSNLGITETAERSYGDLNDPLEDLGTLKIDVVPWIMQPDTDGEGLVDYPHNIDVMVRKRFDAQTQNTSTGKIAIAEIDALILLTEKIWEMFVPSHPNQTGMLTTTSGYEAKWEPRSSRLLQLYVRQHLSKIRQFTGYLRLGYTVTKTV